MEELKPGYKTDKQINKFIKNLPEPIIKTPPNGKLIDEVKFVEEVEHWLNEHVNVFLHDLINDCTIENTRNQKKVKPCIWHTENNGDAEYHTDCGNIHDPYEYNGKFEYCPYCGGKIIIKLDWSEIQKGETNADPET